MRALTPTDLPEPVAPATRRCGILARSSTNTPPSMVFPMGTGRAIFPARAASRNVAVARSWRSRTISRVRFGISTPMELLPGIGAMMRMPGAASAIARSSSSAVIRLILTPGAGVSS